MNKRAFTPFRQRLSTSLKLHRIQRRTNRRVNVVSPAFTIVEFLIVTVIIAILATFVIITYVGIQQKAIVASMNTDLSNAARSLRLFQVDNEAFPSDVNDCPNPAAGNMCLKSSPGNSYTVFSADNGVSPQVFCLTVKNGDTKYHITEDSKPETGTCSFAFANSLTATTASAFSIDLSWDAVTNADSYTLQQSTNSLFTSPTTIASPTGATTTYTSTDLSPNTTYYYRINAIIGGDTSEWSAMASAMTDQLFDLNLTAGTGGTVSQSGTSPYAPNSTPTITASASTYYSFSSWSGTNCTGVASHTVPAMTANMSCTANFTATPISAPSTPTVTANTVGATTTWSWGAASCPGNTARYQYRYTYSPAGYDSGWTAYASTSVPFTTSTESQTYTVQVQAQCYNTATSSSWSGSGSASYYRAISITTFSYTGAVQYYTVPAGRTEVVISGYGAAGGGFYIGGSGGYATGKLAVTPGEVLNVYVGGEGARGTGFGYGGWNGGGNAYGYVYGGGGGGASDVRQGGTALANRVIVAGGGAGAADTYAGGTGGGTAGGDGGQWNSGKGYGGTQSAGGAGGTATYPGAAGSLGQGGAGASNGAYQNGAGGGGGYYGGGGGGGSPSNCGGGGGGSGYIGGVTSASMSNGVRSGNGQVIIASP